MNKDHKYKNRRGMRHGCVCSLLLNAYSESIFEKALLFKSENKRKIYNQYKSIGQKECVCSDLLKKFKHF